jgi:hypothetical protein
MNEYIFIGVFSIQTSLLNIVWNGHGDLENYESSYIRRDSIRAD